MTDDTDLRGHLRGLEHHIEKYHDEEDITLDELFPPDLMERRTAFEDVEAFLEAAPPDAEELEDLRGLSFDDFNSFTEEHTDFDDFVEMFSTAVMQWTREHSDAAHL